MDPARDEARLASQGGVQPTDAGAAPGDGRVFSEDWWSHTRPILELHGYFRTRGELLHNFSLGRTDVNARLWPQPLDNSYTTSAQTIAVTGCKEDPCFDKSQASANMRFRINPELHISDNLRVLAQIDALDNIVLGSTPDAYAIQPLSGTVGTRYGYGSVSANPRAPLSAFSSTQAPPTAGVNGWRNSIDVKRAWAEYMTPVGQVRFGRMPNHWGLGMLENSGDGLDSDYQTTTDRIMFVSGIKSMDLYFGGAWDFVSTGPTSASPYDVNGGQAYNTANRSNVGEWMLFAAHRMNPELQRLALSRGDVVVNGGLYALYRAQELDVRAGTAAQTIPTAPQPDGANNGLEARGAYAFIPDPWLQILWKKFRFEAEFAAVWGNLESSSLGGRSQDAVKIRQYGLATQTEFKAIEDKLRLQFGFGYASGDQWQNDLSSPSNGSLGELNGRGPISTFRFNPDYRVDLILFRRILTQVEGAYYFNPSVQYDFLRNPNGQKFGGGASFVWSRASEYMQAPGHKHDLGIELDLSLYYQAKDGALNDDPDKVGGFYAMLQYGVLFPLAGLGYPPGEVTNAQASTNTTLETSAAQTLRLFLGVAY